MKTIKDLINTKKGRIGLVICAGSSIKEYKKEIDEYIKINKPVTIGINNISHLYIPEYHLWTNTSRFRNFGKNINPKSKILLGSNISIKVIKEVIGNKDYTLINYTDKPEIQLDYRKGKIFGFYRTAGCLAIMILKIMGVNEVNIVGMDGYSLYDEKDLLNKEKSHHCYGEGFTDTASWETCIKKDKLINDIVLKNLRNYGLNFKILTPTKYEEFHDSTRLYI